MTDLGERLAQLSPEKRALLERRLGRAAKGPARPASEPIAIIGLGCRFPGGANSPAAFWALLAEGRDAIVPVPPDRWDAEALNGEAACLRWGGFLDRVDHFDPGFFGIAPREAAQMDPQQRLLLEVAWEALEEAGQTAQQLKGSGTGVFVGIHSQSSDYYWLQIGDRASIDTYTASGGAHSIVANRLSYLLDLRGPSIAVDTACSSSLVAVHLACQGLRTGDCDLALAGGVNLILSPEAGLTYVKMQMLAPDGRCKTFDASANGFVRGEGCGVVVLKRLPDAVRDGDPILAVIRGTAVNQDGATNGLTAPNGLAQRAVVRRALTAGGVAPEAVGYVETHGTGTALGDPIEVEALTDAVGVPRADGRPCLLGSVKANIGHLEAAAGIAGLIKAVLCLHHAAIPPQPQYRSLNPHIRLAGTPFAVPTTLTPWTQSHAVRTAGVSSFGFGGTNAHVVVEEASAAAPRPDASDEAASGTAASLATVLPISARSDGALRGLARAYRERLDSGEYERLADFRDLCYSAAVRRSHHDHRLAVIGRDAKECAARLQSYLTDEASSQVAHGRSEGERPGGPVFVFSGQGPQWPGMGRELLATEPAFRGVIERCDALIQAEGGWSLLDALRAPADVSRLAETEVAQPALFALQVGLAAMWRAWGIEPGAVVGHSLGEVAAAHVAGLLGLEDAVRVVVNRGRIMQQATGKGKMAAVELPADDARQAIAGLGDHVAIAAVNGPASTVLSGEREALDAVVASLTARGVRCQTLPVNYAFHSPQMAPLAAELVKALGEVPARRASIPMISTVTGRAAEGGEGTAAYWGQNVRQPVLFAAAVAECLARSHDGFVEIGPHPVLSGAVVACLAGQGRTGAVAACLRRNQPERLTMLSALGTLYAHGYAVDWSRQYPVRRRCVQLPAYPWQRAHYWLAGRDARPSPADPIGREAWRDWLYTIAWHRKDRPDPARVPQDNPGNGCEGRGAGAWVILADTGGIGERLRSLIEARGGTGFIVRAGEAFESDLDGRFRINPTCPEDFRRLLDSIRTRGVALRGVIHLWSLDVGGAGEEALADLEADAAAGCRSALGLLQAVAARGDGAPPRIWVVTQHAQAVGPVGSPVTVTGAPLWGMGRVAAREHPEIWGGLVDLDGDSVDVCASALLAELLEADGEDQIALRARARYVARLVRAQLQAGPEPAGPLRGDATYLVTGGLGGLGLAVAAWMVARGARHLVLVGRHGPSETAKERIAALERAGATIVTPPADVASREDLTGVFAHIRECLPPLRGILHAAGVFDDRVLLRHDWERFARVLRPKVQGAWNLHLLTRDVPLDFFVLFSSVAALLGLAGLANYCAANAFLGTLAHVRRARGLPALCIDWGAWDRLGMAEAVGEDRRRQWQTVGLTLVPPERALDILGVLLASQTGPAVGVQPMTWSRFLEPFGLGQAPPVFAVLAGEVAARRQAPSGTPAATILPALEAARPSDRPEMLLAHVREHALRVLGADPSRPLEAHQRFFEAGMDSLMAVELKNRLQISLGRPLSATLVFDYPNVAALSQYLGEEVLGWSPIHAPRATTRPPANTPAAATRPELSEDELTALLAARLQRHR